MMRCVDSDLDADTCRIGRSMLRRLAKGLLLFPLGGGGGLGVSTGIGVKTGGRSLSRAKSIDEDLLEYA